MYQDDRLEGVFKCIVEAYIQTAEPVGSRTVSRVYPGGLSPASIRNVMADLEEMGYIQQPHTSAGRIPTALGYRYYVDRMIPGAAKRAADIPEAHETLARAQDIEDVAETASHLLAELTQNAGLAFVRNLARVSYIQDDDAGREAADAAVPRRTGDYHRLYVDGARHVFSQPEFSDIQRAQALLRALEIKRALVQFLEKDIHDDATHVYIGEEVSCEGLREVSMIVKRYTFHGRPVGCLAVMGPIRMRYDHTVGIVSRLADEVSEILDEI
jgi:transcriptional regulator of heat shock response